MWTILVPHSTQLDKERITTSTPESEAGVLVVRRVAAIGLNNPYSLLSRRNK
jgi:hypothetical protein